MFNHIYLDVTIYNKKIYDDIRSVILFLKRILRLFTDFDFKNNNMDKIV